MFEDAMHLILKMKRGALPKITSQETLEKTRK
jgi:hypothetical protein